MIHEFMFDVNHLQISTYVCFMTTISDSMMIHGVSIKSNHPILYPFCMAYKNLLGFLFALLILKQVLHDVVIYPFNPT